MRGAAERVPVGGAPVKYQARRRADLSGRMLRGEDLREVGATPS